MNDHSLKRFRSLPEAELDQGQFPVNLTSALQNLSVRFGLRSRSHVRCYRSWIVGRFASLFTVRTSCMVQVLYNVLGVLKLASLGSGGGERVRHVCCFLSKRNESS